MLKGFIVNSFSKPFTDYLGWILDLQLERETNIIEYLRDKNILYIAQENLFLLLSQYEYDTLIRDNYAVRRVENILYLIIEISIVNEKIVETNTATTIKSCIKYLEGIRNSDKEKHIGNWIDEMVNQIKILTIIIF